METFLLILLICNAPKFEKIFYSLLWKLEATKSLQNYFLQVFLRFFILKLFAS